MEGLQPLLLASPSPRVVAVSSMAALFPVDDELVAELAAGDELAALARAEVRLRTRAPDGGPG